MKRAVLGACLVFASLMLASPAWAGTLVDQAVAGLKTFPVYVDPTATLKLTGAEVNALAQQINKGSTRIYIAVLPAAAADEVGGADALPPAIGRVLGGTVGTVAGKSFRAGSGVLAQGKAASLATLAFNAHHSAGLAPVLSDFIKRVQAETTISTANPTGTSQPTAQPAPDASHTSGWVWFWLALVLVVIIIITLVVISLYKSRKHAQDWIEEQKAEQERQRFDNMTRDTSVTGKRGRKGSRKVTNTQDSGATHRVAEDHPTARYYDGGYYGGAYYGPGYYPNQFLQGMLWSRLMDDDENREHGHSHDHDDNDSASKPSSTKSDFVPPAAPSGDWDSSGDKGSSGGGGNFGDSDDVSTHSEPAYTPPSYDPPSYDPPSMPDFGGGGGGGDFGGGGGSGGGGDF